MNLIDVNGLFSGGGAFDRGGAEDSIDFPILNGLALLLQDLRGDFFPLISKGCSGLRTNS